MSVVLHGYSFSVYRRIARLALEEKGLAYTCVEVDPFATPVPETYLAMHPFGRVPTLVHGDFVLYETVAITRYVDEAFDGPPLQPDEPRQRARMQQVISIIDSYGYWPLVRQVFSHGVFRPMRSLPGDRDQVSQGLVASARVLHALERLVAPGPFFLGDRISLADIHLAPMVAYFAAAPEAAAMISHYPGLSDWWTRMADRPTMQQTIPDWTSLAPAGTDRPQSQGPG
ncbi:MAG: glutathione S-transferase family protein [Acetobacteraceae bacterium]|nr:glutathione S-transferase family protein [Pseudomonadota bacterium]